MLPRILLSSARSMAQTSGEIATAQPHPRRAWLTVNLLPLLTSLAVHVGLVVLGLLTFKVIQVATTQPSDDYVTPETVVLPYVSRPSSGGIPNAGPANFDPLQKFAQGDSPDVHPSADGFSRSTPLPGGESNSGSSNPAASSFGPGTGPFGNSGSGDGGGSPGPFGLPGGWRGEPGTGMFHDPAAAHKIAYLCDASGSMLAKMETLRLELAKSVMALRPTQSFNVIFFQDAGYKSLARELIPANPSNKHSAQAFLLDVTASGQTNPIPALESAFRQRPELIFLLTDGDFPDNAAVLKRISELNRDHRVRVNTIAFVTAADTDTGFIALLQQIARESGGTYRHVQEDAR